MTKAMQFKMGERRTRQLAVPFDIKGLEDDGTFEGYGSVFGTVDSYKEVVAAGAFKASLKGHAKAGTLPAMLWQHRPAEPIGVYTAMREDAKGLWVEGKFVLESAKGQEAHALLKAGAINGLSIGFVPKKSEFDEDEGIRTLTEIDLWEVSLVTFPANGDALVAGVKAEDIESLKDAEHILRDAGCSRSEAVALVSRIKAIAAQSESDAQGFSEVMDSVKRAIDILSH